MTTELPEIPRFTAEGSFTAAREGCEIALGDVLNSYRDYLLVVAARAMPADLQAKAGASDLVQQTFFEAHRDFETFRGDSEAELLVWLRRILLHNLEDFIRRYRHCTKRQVQMERPLGSHASRTPSGLPRDFATPSRLVADREQAAQLQGAVQRLKPEYRTVLRLRYWEGQSFEQIGIAIDRSGEAARKLWFRAVQALQRELGRMHDELVP